MLKQLGKHYADKHRLKTGLFLFATFFAFASLGYLAKAPGPQARPSPLHVGADALNFGTVWAQPEFKWRVPIENTSGQPISVASIRSSCKCSSVEPESFVIAPGETVDVTIVLDLMPTSSQEASAQTRPFTLSLIPEVENGPGLTERSKWELRGSVSQLFSLRPASVYFGERLVQGIPYPKKSLRVESHERLQSLEALCDESLGSATVTPLDASGKLFDVEFTLNEELPDSTIDSRIFLTGTPADGTSLPPMPVAVGGQISLPIYAQPAALQLGAQDLRKTFTTQLKVRSAVHDQIRLVDTVHDDQIDRIECQSDVNMVDELSLSLTVTPTAPGHHDSILRVAVEAENGSIETVNVPVRWYAVDPLAVTEADCERITPEGSPGEWSKS